LRDGKQTNFMNFTKIKRGFALVEMLIIMAIIGLFAALAIPARAQNGFDMFLTPRVAIVENVRQLDNSAATFASLTCDTHGYEGIAAVVITSITNGAASSVLTVTPQTSPDQVTWSTLTNFAVAKSATVIYTNLYYGTNGLTATNTYLLAGTITSPTAATAGFATPYLDPTSTPFTNVAAITISAKGTYLIGYNLNDAPRYFRVLWTPTGTSSNDVVSATLLGRKQQWP
jgi:prepilin-type N-terminal cleavage/methylation domain-containing protein